MNTQDLLDFRRDKDEYFRTGDHTPLGPGEHSDFVGLDYFEPNPDLVFTVPVEPGDGAVVRVTTSDDSEKVYTRFGKVALEICGVPVELTLYNTGHAGLFLPFKDATSGKTTYAAGRYLDIDLNDDDTVTIDFNYAYNPSCVYSDGWSCPIPPTENWLSVPVEAGERDYRPSGS